MALFARKDASLRIDLPPAQADRAITTKVGLIAAVGFVVGIAWPRLLGVHVGPDVPGGGPRPTEGTAAAKTAPAVGSPSGEAPAEPTGPEEESPTNKQQVVVADGVVDSCRNKKGDKVEDCGKLAFDRLAKSRLAGLSRCPAALGLEGKLSVGVAINFEKNDVLVLEGQKSQLPSSTVKGVLACAADELKGIELEKVPHTHARYQINYEVGFYPPGKAPPAPGDEGAPTAEAPSETGLGTATVTWEKALVRETPKDGKVVTRIPQGTRLKLLQQDDDWYLVETGRTKGWVYRQAIGK